MKDKMYLVIILISLGFLGYGLYELITGLNNETGGQGTIAVVIGVFMLVVTLFFKKNDKPGR